MRKWIYAAVAFLIAASWIGNGLYHRSMQLPGSMFLKHYIEMTDGPGAQFDLRYLENINAERRINGIAIDELPGVRITQYPDDIRYSYQRLGKISVQFTLADPVWQEGSAGKPVVIHSVRVFYNDGSEEQADIGEIRIIPEKRVAQADESSNNGDSGTPDAENGRDGNGGQAAEQSPFQFTSGGSSSNNSGFDSFQATRPVQLTGVSSHYLSQLAPWLQVYADVNVKGMPATPAPSERTIDDSTSSFDLSGVPVESLAFPVSLKANDWMKITYQFLSTGTERVREPFAVYRLILQLSFLDETGRDWMRPIFIDYSPSLSESDVRSIVRSRRDAS